MENPDYLLKPKQAAEVLGVAVASLAKWRVSGAGPAFIKIGAAVRYRPKDLNSWMAKRRATSTAELMGRQ